MDLNSIKLQPQQVAALFGKMLVTDPGTGQAAQIGGNAVTEKSPAADLPRQKPEAAVVNERPSTILPFLGGNKKKVTILVHYPDQAYLPDAEFSFLGNILHACQLSADDTAIVNTARQPVSYTDLLTQLHPASIICFGQDARPAGWPSPALLQPEKQEAVQLLEAPALDTLNQPTAPSKTLKKQLWESLQKIFSV